VLKFSRLENVEAFVRYKRHECRVAQSNSGEGEVSQARNMPSWLQKLSRKNGLNSEANTVYLLHGATQDKLERIVQDGLKTSFSLATRGTYGKGLYFADNSCKASQFGKIILVCRVVGRSEVLSGKCPTRLFASPGFNSAMAKKGVTPAPHGRNQLHNEYIIYHANACYPEFVIEYELV
jgi:Poly(ADP-ribose) polymerase catalytic domain